MATPSNSSDQSELQSEVNTAIERLKIDELNARLDELQAASQQPDFWDDSANAQDTMKQIARLEARVQPWLQLRKQIDDASEILALNDPALKDELDASLQKAQVDFDELKEELKFNGPYDDHNAIISIYAGAGGTDAQDWAQMLFRMYHRYFENNRWDVTIVDESPGEEAGLKSVTMEV